MKNTSYPHQDIDLQEEVFYRKGKKTSKRFTDKIHQTGGRNHSGKISCYGKGGGASRRTYAPKLPSLLPYGMTSVPSTFNFLYKVGYVEEVKYNRLKSRVAIVNWISSAFRTKDSKPFMGPMTMNKVPYSYLNKNGVLVRDEMGRPEKSCIPAPQDVWVGRPVIMEGDSVEKRLNAKQELGHFVEAFLYSAEGALNESMEEYEQYYEACFKATGKAVEFPRISFSKDVMDSFLHRKCLSDRGEGQKVCFIGGDVACSPGTYAIVRGRRWGKTKSGRGELVVCELPSGELKELDGTLFCRSGKIGRENLNDSSKLRNSTILVINGSQLEKDGAPKKKSRAVAGRSRHLGKRPTVRGVAMNPVDHPHGGGEGKSSGGRPSVTPWGKPAKGKPTSRSTTKMKRKKKKID